MLHAHVTQTTQLLSAARTTRLQHEAYCFFLKSGFACANTEQTVLCHIGGKQTSRKSLFPVHTKHKLRAAVASGAEVTYLGHTFQHQLGGMAAAAGMTAVGCLACVQTKSCWQLSTVKHTSHQLLLMSSPK